jgi:hypothetical protein
VFGSLGLAAFLGGVARGDGAGLEVGSFSMVRWCWAPVVVGASDIKMPLSMTAISRRVHFTVFGHKHPPWTNPKAREGANRPSLGVGRAETAANALPDPGERNGRGRRSAGVSLTGTPLVSLLVIMAVGLPVVVVVAWRRAKPGLIRVVLGFVGIVCCQALAVAAAGVVANNTYGFYNSWADLIGTPRQAPLALSNGLVAQNGSQGRIITLPVALPGPQHNQDMDVLVWVPKEYDQPSYHNLKFPVTMMLPGQPNTPQGVFTQFKFGAEATQAIERHLVKPFVAVFPPIMIDPPRDTECTDVRGGPQAETWLASNVRRAVIRHLRVNPDGRQWSALGWSTGGFCAAKLMLRHRTLFQAAVGIGAYYDAETDHSTGNLFNGSAQLRNENSPLWLVKQPGNQNALLLIIVSKMDRDSYDGIFYADSKKMIEATRGHPGVSTIELPQGGHNYRVYRPTLPAALTWLEKNAGL